MAIQKGEPMSDILSQAEELRQKAIALLVSERQAIDEKLATLGHDGTAKPSTRKPTTCAKCGEVGHTVRTCPVA